MLFDIGLGEAAFIALLAVVLVGPERLPGYARQAGRFLQSLRKLAHNARDDLRDELGPEYSQLELRDLDPRTMVKKQILAAMEEEPAAEKPVLGLGEVPPYDDDAT